MRTPLRVLLWTLVSLGAAIGVPAAARQGTPPVPILVELFTSEGCSSCPPADNFLMEMAAHPSVGSATLVTLSEHVDYWDSQGWRDPFSSASFTSRQTAYAQRIGDGQVATPSMVVDGQAMFIGSDRQAALRAITAAAKAPKAPMMLAWTSAAKPTVTIALEPSALTTHAAVTVAIAEDGLQSSVLRGENAGHTLSHTSVTRRLDVVGQTSADGSYKLELPLKVDGSWNRSALKLVVFAQNTQKRIVSAGVLAFPRAATAR